MAAGVGVVDVCCVVDGLVEDDNGVDGVGTGFHIEDDARVTDIVVESNVKAVENGEGSGEFALAGQAECRQPGRAQTGGALGAPHRSRKQRSAHHWLFEPSDLHSFLTQPSKNCRQQEQPSLRHASTGDIEELVVVHNVERIDVWKVVITMVIDGV